MIGNASSSNPIRRKKSSIEAPGGRRDAVQAIGQAKAGAVQLCSC